jgi:hypothetical protein
MKNYKVKSEMFVIQHSAPPVPHSSNQKMHQTEVAKFKTQ